MPLKLSDRLFRNLSRFSAEIVNYSIHDNQLLILVLKIGHRRDVYQ
jgi:hypothetical protein